MSERKGKPMETGPRIVSTCFNCNVNLGAPQLPYFPACHATHLLWEFLWIPPCSSCLSSSVKLTHKNYVVNCGSFGAFEDWWASCLPKRLRDQAFAFIALLRLPQYNFKPLHPKQHCCRNLEIEQSLHSFADAGIEHIFGSVAKRSTVLGCFLHSILKQSQQPFSTFLSSSSLPNHTFCGWFLPRAKDCGG